jgi:hypothetical protein
MLVNFKLDRQNPHVLFWFAVYMSKQKLIYDSKKDNNNNYI